MDYNKILEVIEDEILKCTDYPKYQALKNFDPNNFTEETYSDGQNKNWIPSPRGELQKIQEELQEDVEYTNLERGALDDYQTNSYIPLNRWLNGEALPTTPYEKRVQYGFMGYIKNADGELIGGRDQENEKGEFVMVVNNYPNGWDDETGHEFVTLSMPQEDQLIHRAIEKSPKLAQDTVLYTYRELPKDLKVNNHGVIKGYGSTSFNSHVIDDIEQNGPWVQGEKDRRYKVKVYAPQGTDGLVFTDKVTGGGGWQSEWLLDKNQKYILLSRNDETMEAEILLY